MTSPRVSRGCFQILSQASSWGTLTSNPRYIDFKQIQQKLCQRQRYHFSLKQTKNNSFTNTSNNVHDLFNWQNLEGLSKSFFKNFLNRYHFRVWGPHPGAGSNFSLMPALGGWLVTITHGYLNGRPWDVEVEISRGVCPQSLLGFFACFFGFAAFCGRCWWCSRLWKSLFWHELLKHVNQAATLDARPLFVDTFGKPAFFFFTQFDPFSDVFQTAGERNRCCFFVLVLWVFEVFLGCLVVFVSASIRHLWWGPFGSESKPNVCGLRLQLFWKVCRHTLTGCSPLGT